MNVLPLLGLFLPTEMTLPYPPNTLTLKWNAYSFLYLNPEKVNPFRTARCPLDGIRVLAANCFSFYSFKQWFLYDRVKILLLGHYISLFHCAKCIVFDPNELKQELIILHLIKQELTHISELPCNTEDRSLPWPWFLESRLSLIAE